MSARACPSREDLTSSHHSTLNCGYGVYMSYADNIRSNTLKPHHENGPVTGELRSWSTAVTSSYSDVKRAMGKSNKVGKFAKITTTLLHSIHGGPSHLCTQLYGFSYVHF